MTATKLAFAAVVVAYPFIVFFGLQHFEARVIAIALVAIAVARLLLLRRLKGSSLRMPQSGLIVAALLLVGVLTMASNSPILLMYYPVCVNALMFLLFFSSLFREQSIIEQIARIGTPDLPEAGVRYTRKVTMVWCGFFVLNGSMALYTTLDTSMSFWVTYNGFVSYALMGLLFGGELIVRRFVQRNASSGQRTNAWR